MTAQVSSPPSDRLAQEEVQRTKELLERVRREVQRVFLGDAALLDAMLTALMAQGHLLLEGVPGVAKTTLAKAFAQVTGCSVRRIQFTPDLLPADITGSYVLNPSEGSFKFRPGPIFANVVLADEINRAPAKTQSALLEAMQERQVTIEGDRFELPATFFVLATQNPIDLAGTYPLPEAQLDRFLMRLRLGYPSVRDEVAMLRTHGVATPTPRALMTANEVTALQALASRVHVEDDLREYAVQLSRFTREHPRVILGTSPRASLSLVRAAKGHALLVGRAYLTPDDIRVVAEPVLAHRLVLVPELEGSAQAQSEVVQEALTKVSYRREVKPT